MDVGDQAKVDSKNQTVLSQGYPWLHQMSKKQSQPEIARPKQRKMNILGRKQPITKIIVLTVNSAKMTWRRKSKQRNKGGMDVSITDFDAARAIYWWCQMNLWMQDKERYLE